MTVIEKIIREGNGKHPLSSHNEFYQISIFAILSTCLHDWNMLQLYINTMIKHTYSHRSVCEADKRSILRMSMRVQRDQVQRVKLTLC